MIRVERDDRGVTLVEVVVSMSVFGMLMAIFTTGVVSMFRSAQTNIAMATAVSQANIAFVQLDKQIRYAGAIASPTDPPLSSGYYVEYLINGETVGGGLGDYCHELWYSPATQRLKGRAWQTSAAPGSTWSTYASNVIITGKPFTLVPPAGAVTFQRLTLDLTAYSGSGATFTQAQTRITFTALNTNSGTQSPTTCTNRRPAS